MTMEVLDYGASFLVGKWPENQVRFWVESRTVVRDETRGWNETFYQCAACKSENTFAPTELFHKENYDFTPVFGDTFGAIFRRRAYAHDGYKEVKAADAMWGGVVSLLRKPRRVQPLRTPAEIAEATHAGLPLVGRTTFSQDSLHVVVEFPIKTMNIHVARGMYQVDTGPVAFPNRQGGEERPVDTLALAYVAFNVEHFAEFILEAKTPIGRQTDDASLQVYHYSHIVTLPTHNELFAVVEPASLTP